MERAVQLTLDPWASDVDAAVAIAADESAPPPPIDVTVEKRPWAAVDPPTDAEHALDRGAPLLFIDGVLRVDARVIVSTVSDGFGFGLLGAYGVGAVRAGAGPPEVIHLATRRLLILGRGCEHPEMSVPLPGGGGTLRYAPMAVPGEDPDCLSLALKAAMRRDEADLARTLAAGVDGTRPSLIIADGPLAYLERTATPLIGLIKSLRRTYLRPPENELLPRLRPGQRTPVLSILDQNQRYTWYVRLTAAAPGEHELAGIARLECSSQAGLAAACAMANRAAVTLGRFASTRTRDARSPQNLVPIGGLEAALHHRLGDRGLIHRAIRAELARAQRDVARLPAPEHEADPIPIPIPAGEAP